MLFQPKNDNLLFAYFGISLQIKQRTLKSEILNRLSIKKKVSKNLNAGSYILIKDATDDRYPYKTEEDLIDQGRWAVKRYGKCLATGVELLLRQHYAYFNPQNKEWDYDEVNDYTHCHDPWVTKIQGSESEMIWGGLPREHKMWLSIYIVIPYENILAIDELGDEYVKEPHLYTVNWAGGADGNIFIPGEISRIELKKDFDLTDYSKSTEENRRVKIFPRKV